MSYLDLYLKPPMITQHGKEKHPDVYVFGVPFDATCSYRPGTRFGPNAIRDAFTNIEVNSTRYNADLENMTIEDLGNTKFTVNTEVMLDVLRKVMKEIDGKNKQTAVLGGEHLITLGTFMSIPDSTALLVFDAHYDLRDEYADTKISHATFLRRIIEERGAGSIVHVGARGFDMEEADYSKKVNLRSIPAKEIQNGDAVRMLKDAISSFESLYLSIDLDVVDPAFAPGVGTPESLGITPNQLMNLLYTLEEKRVRCFDIVELSPPYDNGATAALAAKLMAEIICMNAGS